MYCNAYRTDLYDREILNWQQHLKYSVFEMLAQSVFDIKYFSEKNYEKFQGHLKSFCRAILKTLLFQLQFKVF